MPPPLSRARTSRAGRPGRTRAISSPPPACLTRFVPSSLTSSGQLLPRHLSEPGQGRPAPPRGGAPLRPDCGRRSGRRADPASLALSDPAGDVHPGALPGRGGDLELVGQPLGSAQTRSRGRSRSCSRPPGPDATSAMPGPLSVNVSRSPRRAPSCMASSRTAPPPPWTRVLRASSLAAVTILVWSTSRKPTATASSRVICRTRTTSVSDWIPSVSSRRTATVPPP